MCAICGISFQKNSKVFNSTMIHQILNKLLINCQVRGRSATGVAVANDKEIKVVKNNMPAKEFVKSTEFREVLKNHVSLTKEISIGGTSKRLIQIIGHCRMPTKGSALNNKNNHPIVTDTFVGVHNGVISNDDDLFKTHQNSFKRNGEVDSEIIFKLIEKYYLSSKNMESAILSASNELVGSSVCAFITTHNTHLLWLFRNNGPISILHYKDVGIIVFASVREHITKAVKGFSIGAPNDIPLLPYEGMGIDLNNGVTRHFNIVGQTTGYA